MGSEAHFFSSRFREGISFPNFVESSVLKLPLLKRCIVPFALQNRAFFEGKKGVKRCRDKGRKRGGQQRGQKGKSTHENRSGGVFSCFSFFLRFSFLPFSSLLCRFSSLFSHSARGQRWKIAIYCKNGEFHSDTVCTDPVRNFPNTKNSQITFSCVRASATTGPGCTRAKLHSARNVHACIGFVGPHNSQSIAVKEF